MEVERERRMDQMQQEGRNSRGGVDRLAVGHMGTASGNRNGSGSHLAKLKVGLVLTFIPNESVCRY